MKINLALCIAISIALSAHVASACPMTITNNTKESVFLYDTRENKSGMLIKPGASQKFGTAEQHLHFCLMTSKNGTDYHRAVIIEQHSCATKPLKYTVTDLIAGKIDMELFEKPVSK
jgi:hypothetical protein